MITRQSCTINVLTVLYVKFAATAMQSVGTYLTDGIAR